MNYEIYSTLAEADQASRDEAVTQGCQPPTTHWWPVYSHEDGRGAVIKSIDDTIIYNNSQALLALGFEKVG